MTNRFSALFYRPNSRFLLAHEEGETGDRITKRVREQLKKPESPNDLKLHFVLFELPKRTWARGLIEAMAIGGASSHDIARATGTDLEIVDLHLKTFFDLDPIRTAPLALQALIETEENPEVREYKRFSLCHGWRDFLFFMVGQGGTTRSDPSRLLDDMLSEICRRIMQYRFVSPGSEASKELVSLIKASCNVIKLKLEIDKETPAEEAELYQLLEDIRKVNKYVPAPTISTNASVV